MNIYGILTMTMLIVIFTWIEVFSSKRTYLYSILLLLIFSITICLRNNTLPDTSDYTRLYLELPPFFKHSDNPMYYYYFEAGYTFLVRSIKLIIGNNVKLFYAITTFFNGCCFLYVIYRIKTSKLISENIRFLLRRLPYSIGIVLYIAYYGVWYNAVVIRQGLAMSFIFIMTIEIIEKKYIRGFLALFIALLFHRISFLGLAIVVIIYVFPILKRKTYILIAITMPIIGIFDIGYNLYKIFSPILRYICSNIEILNRFVYYIDNMEYGNYSKTSLFFYLLCLYFIYYSLEESLYYKLFNVYLVGITLTFLLQFVQWSYRITDVFLIFSVPLLYMSLISKKQNNKWKKRFCIDYMFIILVFIIILIRVFKP